MVGLFCFQKPKGFMVLKAILMEIRIKNRIGRVSRSKEFKEARERQPECTMYMRIGVSAADAEICRSSAADDRTRKLSSCADGSWDFVPVRVGRR